MSSERLVEWSRQQHEEGGSKLGQVCDLPTSLGHTAGPHVQPRNVYPAAYRLQERM